MSYTKTIVCLANSWKHDTGRCVAGREFARKRSGEWVRPVGDRDGQEVSEEERHYENGDDPNVLDIIAVPLLKALPKGHQQENHLLDPTAYWVKKGVVSWAELQGAVENVTGPLWVNGHSTYNGVNDQVPEAVAKKQRRSLFLVRPERLAIVVAKEGGVFGPVKKKVRAQFRLAGHDYRLSVTDPLVASEHKTKGEGETDVRDGLLCVSLGEIYKGHAYKLVAAVVTAKRAREAS